MASKIVNGARAILYIGTTPIGMFESCSTSVALDTAQAWILGRYTVGANEYVGAEMIQIQASGFRVLDHGPFSTADASSGASLFPLIQNLAETEDLTISLHDRTQTDPEKGLIMSVSNCKARSWNSGVSARSLSQFSMTFEGIFYSDESGSNAEAAGAAEIPN
jgi:hypothetical protein